MNEGPLVDFEIEGKCELQTIAFINTTQSSVDSFEWNFGDDESVIAPSAEHTYLQSGEYSVSLTAASGNCTNVKTQSLQVYHKPEPFFEIQLPPYSCTEQEIQFSNLTEDPGNNIVTNWLWNFNDDSSEENESENREPVHIYTLAGEYQVSLKATNDKGCFGEIILPITVAQSPESTISFDPVCADTPAPFLASGSGISFYYWEMGTSYYQVPNPTHTFVVPGDYNVKLVITGDNDCITIYNQPVHVPQPLVPNFNVVKNCVGYEAQFSDLTTGDDPVESYTWNFGNEGSSDLENASFIFTSEGSKLITLDVLTESGCTYSAEHTIVIVPAPVASFFPSAQSGAVPLEVEFTNQSDNANVFVWNYGNGDTSEEFSPTNTFNELGEYEVELMAINPQGCQDTDAATILVEQPRPDVDVKLINVSENPNGTLKVIITLENKGNTVLKNLPVEIDISGNVRLTETIKETIRPLTMHNLVLDYGIHPANGVQFLCAETSLPDDLYPEGDRVCKDFDNGVVVFSPFPNPAQGHLNFEWIAPKDQTVKIKLTDSYGKTVFEAEVVSEEGLNQRSINTGELRDGIYLLTLKGGVIHQNHRILVSGRK